MQNGRWTCQNVANTIQNGRWTCPHVRNPMQNGRWTCQNVANTIQNGRWTCPNVANTMQNDKFKFQTVANTRQMVPAKKSKKNNPTQKKMPKTISHPYLHSAVSRIEAVDLVEECSVVMWNISRELLADENRFRVHKPLQRLDKSLENIRIIRFMVVSWGGLSHLQRIYHSMILDV